MQGVIWMDVQRFRSPPTVSHAIRENAKLRGSHSLAHSLTGPKWKTP